MKRKYGNKLYILIGLTELVWVHLMFVLLIVLLIPFALYRFAESQLFHRGYL